MANIDKIKWATLNARLREYSSGAEPDYNGFLLEARNWSMDTQESCFAWATVIVLTEMQCEWLISSGDDADVKSMQAHKRYKLLQRLRERLPDEVLEFLDTAKHLIPKAMVEKMPWLS